MVDLRSELGGVVVERDVVTVAGPDAVTFLQGQLSQDVASLEVGASRWAFLLEPDGHVQSWLRVARRADDLVLDLDAGWGAPAAERLGRFLLRTDATLTTSTTTMAAVRGPGAAALGGLDAAWPGVETADLLDEASLPAGVAAASADDLRALRIEAGVPALGAELVAGTIPAEAGQHVIDASVSFTKGCFTGQELVARIDSRGGNVPRPLRGLVAEGPLQPGAAVSLDGEAVGHVTSAATSPTLGPVALAVLARRCAPGAGVVVDGVAATVAALPLLG